MHSSDSKYNNEESSVEIGSADLTNGKTFNFGATDTAALAGGTTHLFRLLWLIIYAGVLILIATLSLILRNVLAARWAMLAIVCIIGALWADKEFGVFTVVKKRMKSH